MVCIQKIPQSFLILSAVNVGSLLLSEVFQMVFLYCAATCSSLGEVPWFMNFMLNLFQAECEQSRWSRSKWDCSKHIELLDHCHWSIHMCSTHLQHNIWLKGLWCWKLVPALWGHSSNVTFHGVHTEWFCKEPDENNGKGHGQTGHNGGSNKRFVSKTSLCVYASGILHYKAVMT